MSEFYRTVVTAPVREPVTLQQAKDHLRVDQDYEDSIIEPLIVAARQKIELDTGKPLITQTILFTNKKDAGFPVGAIDLCANVQSISSVKYDDEDGNEQTMDAANYVLDTSRVIARIRPAYNSEWPAARAFAGSIRIAVVAGYGENEEDVPQNLRTAMLFMIERMKENDPRTITALESATDSLCGPEMVYFL